MADTWFYARGEARTGPFSGRQLRDLADAGTILETDTVYKTGVEQGMLAAKVKHLFPSVVDDPPPVAVELAPVVAAPEPKAESQAPKPFQEPPPRRRMATAGKGTIMMGQDGTQVKFKKQCTTCQQIDSSVTTMKISPGTMRSGFFCSKCKRRRECELRGS